MLNRIIVLIAVGLICPVAALAGPKKSGATPKVSIAFDVYGELEMSISHQDESGPESCVQGSEEKTHHVYALLDGGWKSIPMKAGSYQSKDAFVHGNSKSRAEIGLNLKSCKSE